ncbi:MAG TPA: DUF4230 domain-containing protein, partial [Micromonospora sp.]
MSQDGGVNEPTREFPEYARGQAIPAEPARGADDGPVEPVEPTAGGEPPTPDPAGPPPGRGGCLRGCLVVLAGLVAVAVLAVVGLKSLDIWPSWRNPFAQEQTDRSQPPLLKSIQDLSRYVAAEGNFQVVIDLQKDRKYVPDFLLKERTLFVGAGTVEAYVDFSQIAQSAVVESADHRTVELKLPAPQLGRTNLDLEKSYVFAEERGLLNRLGEVFGGDPNRQR